MGGSSHLSINANALDSQHQKVAAGSIDDAKWELTRLVNRHKSDLQVISTHSNQEDAERAYSNYDGVHNIGFLVAIDSNKAKFLHNNTKSKKDGLPWDKICQQACF